jgi:NitT/TauT family transport system substrate-binding protein
LRRPTAGFGLIIALVAASAGCSSASSSSTGNTAVTTVSGLEKTHLNVAYLPIIQDAPLFLAIKNGYFAREGLTVSTVPEVASTAALPGMANGSIDLIAGANYESFFAMQALGKFNMKIIADSSQCDAQSLVVLALTGSHITGPASLLGKTVAVQINPDIQTITLNAELAADGLNPARIRYVVIPFPQMNTALKEGKVDAVAQVEPFASQAEAQLGAKVVMSYCSPPVGDFPEAGYVSSAAWAAKYPRTALAFQRAVEQAQTLAATNRGAVEKVLPSFIPHMTAQIADIVDIGVFPTSLNAVRLQRLVDLMVQSGIIPPGRLNVQSLLLN